MQLLRESTLPSVTATFLQSSAIQTESTMRQLKSPYLHNYKFLYKDFFCLDFLIPFCSLKSYLYSMVTQTDRHTDRHTDTQIHTQTQTQTHAHTHTHTQTDTYRHIQTDTHTYRHDDTVSSCLYVCVCFCVCVSGVHDGEC